MVDARVMLIAAMESEVTIARSGRLLFKTPDPEVAERTFHRLRRLLEAGPRRPPAPEKRGESPRRGQQV